MLQLSNIYFYTLISLLMNVSPMEIFFKQIFFKQTCQSFLNKPSPPADDVNNNNKKKEKEKLKPSSIIYQLLFSTKFHHKYAISMSNIIFVNYENKVSNRINWMKKISKFILSSRITKTALLESFPKLCS